MINFQGFQYATDSVKINNMSKIIIDVRDDIGDYEALEAVKEVVNMGKISKDSKGKEYYCWHTEIYNKIHVSTMDMKSKTVKFIVHKNKSK